MIEETEKFIGFNKITRLAVFFPEKAMKMNPNKNTMNWNK